MKVFVRIRDKETNQESKEIPLEDLLYKPNEVEFEFDDLTTFPNKDMSFYEDDYEYVIRVIREVEDDE